MKIKLVRYVRKYKTKKWVLFNQQILGISIPLSAMEEYDNDNGVYRVSRTSSKLVIFKHLAKCDIKKVYSYVS